MLEHLSRQGVTGRLELVLVDRGVTAAAARMTGRSHTLEVRRLGWDDKQPVFRPIRHAWRVEVAHGRLGRARRLAKSFEKHHHLGDRPAPSRLYRHYLAAHLPRPNTKVSAGGRSMKRALGSEVLAAGDATVPYRAPMSPDQPPADVLDAFGVEQPPRPLAGGQGASWFSGDLVLKPGGDPVHEWLAETLDDVSPAGVRLAAPVRTLHGTWSWEGWTAARWVEGTEPDRTKLSTWLEIIEAGRAFHRAVTHLHRPDCLDARDDWWAVGDRVAWREHGIRFRPEFANLSQRLQRAVEPLGAPQIVHGDLTGNVLLSHTLPPAVIDISPYWRPPEYAEGVVIADALCWHSAGASLLDQAGVSVAAVARALLFRMATTSQAVSVGGARVDVEDEARRYDRAAGAVGV